MMAHRGPGYRIATKIRLGLDVKFPMDLLVRSSAELRKGVSQQDWFIVEVLEKGIVLHDRANPAVGAKGRSRLRRRFASAAVTKTHDLVALLAMLVTVEPTWQPLQAELAAMTDAAVEFRYPNKWSGNIEARAAYATCRRLRSRARLGFGLKI